MVDEQAVVDDGLDIVVIGDDQGMMALARAAGADKTENLHNLTCFSLGSFYMVEQSFYRLGIDGKDADLFGETACRAVEIRAAADVPMAVLSQFQEFFIAAAVLG